jgi:hypothetical protein
VVVLGIAFRLVAAKTREVGIIHAVPATSTPAAGPSGCTATAATAATTSPPCRLRCLGWERGPGFGLDVLHLAIGNYHREPHTLGQLPVVRGVMDIAIWWGGPHTLHVDRVPHQHGGELELHQGDVNSFHARA